MKKLLTLLLAIVTMASVAQDSLLNWNREITVISCTVRRAPTGWQFVTPDHDPLGFSGQITATSSSLTLDMNFDGLGLNPAQWTPSGVVVGADETYAREGHTFGASVSSSSIVIQGCNGIIPSQQIVYTGTTWSGASGYTASWNSTLQCLQLDRILTDNSNYRQGIQAGGVPGIAIQSNVSNLTQLFYNAVLVSNTNTQIRIAFYNNGVRVTAPDTNMKVVITDYCKRPQSFDFTSNVSALQSSSNLWIVGTFVKINSPALSNTESDSNFYAYPNPSSGRIQLSSNDEAPVTVYDGRGTRIFFGELKDLVLTPGSYIIHQGENATRVVVN